MRRFINPAILVLCMVALVTAAAPETDSDHDQALDRQAATLTGAAKGNIDYIQVAEDIDIMARIIDKTLGEEFPDEYKSRSQLMGSSGCQGIYLKGYGAVFMTSINFPLAEREEWQVLDAPDDLWQQMKYELRGTSSAASYYKYSSPGGEYDSAKVDGLKGDLLRLIGTYAPNIRQLGSQENVVIAVRGTSDLLQLSKLNVKTAKPQATKTAGRRQRTKKKSGNAPEVPVAPKTAKTIPRGSVKSMVVDQRTNSVIVTTDNNTVRILQTPSISASERTMLIVRAKKQSIMEYKEGALDFDDFMKQTEVIQY